MLVACRLAGLSALEGHYAAVRARAKFGPTLRSRNKPMNGHLPASGWSA
jgi:hypothetical protein